MNATIIEMARQGHSQNAIARHLGMSVRKLHDHISGQPGMRAQLISIRDERLRERPGRILALFRSGLTRAEVSAALGVSSGYINQLTNAAPELATQVRQARLGRQLAQEYELIELIAHHGFSRHAATKAVGLSPTGFRDRVHKDPGLQDRIIQAQERQRFFGGPFSILLPRIDEMREQGHEETVIAALLGLSLGTLQRLLHEHRPRHEEETAS